MRLQTSETDADHDVYGTHVLSRGDGRLEVAGSLVGTAPFGEAPVLSTFVLPIDLL